MLICWILPWGVPPPGRSGGRVRCALRDRGVSLGRLLAVHDGQDRAQDAKDSCENGEGDALRRCQKEMSHDEQGKDQQ